MAIWHYRNTYIAPRGLRGKTYKEIIIFYALIILLARTIYVTHMCVDISYISTDIHTNTTKETIVTMSYFILLWRAKYVYVHITNLESVCYEMCTSWLHLSLPALGSVDRSFRIISITIRNCVLCVSIFRKLNQSCNFLIIYNYFNILLQVSLIVYLFYIKSI